MVLVEGQLFHELDGERDPTLPPVQKSPSHLEGLPTANARTAPAGPRDPPPSFQNASVDFMFDEVGKHEIHVGLPGVKTGSLRVDVKDCRLVITGKHKDEHGRPRPIAMDVKLPRSADPAAGFEVIRADYRLVVKMPNPL